MDELERKLLDVLADVQALRQTNEPRLEIPDL